MLVTLVVVFAVCWLPVHLFNLVIDLQPSVLDRIRTQQDERLYIGIFYICHWLAMSNSFANPVIYCFLSDSFRVSVRGRLVKDELGQTNNFDSISNVGVQLLTDSQILQ